MLQTLPLPAGFTALGSNPCGPNSSGLWVVLHTLEYIAFRKLPIFSGCYPVFTELVLRFLASPHKQRLGNIHVMTRKNIERMISDSSKTDTILYNLFFPGNNSR